MENTSDYFMPRPLLFCIKSEKSVCYSVPDNKKVYHVHIDTEHPRKSVCDCVFAKGRRVICKHMIALYFTAEPKAAQAFRKKIEEWEAEEEERERQYYEALEKYVKSLPKKELQEKLFHALVELEEKK